jgi:hypothetical protein
MNMVQAMKIDVTFVHDIEGTRLENHVVEKMDIVHLTACNADKRRDIGPQVQLGMHFDCAFVSAMLCPGKQRQAQIDDCGIQSIYRAFEIHAQGLIGVKPAGLVDENHSNVAIDSPVAYFVGLGQSVAGDSRLHASVIELGTDSSQASFDVTQTLSSCHLSKGHTIELIETGKRSDAMIASVASDAGIETPSRKEVHEL